MLTCKHDLKWKILYFMTCASVNVTYIGPIHLSFNIIKFKSACILNYKFRWSDILFSLEFCFSGLFQGLSRLNQDFFRTILGMTIFQDSTRLNQDFSGHFSAAGTLPTRYNIESVMRLMSVVYKVLRLNDIGMKYM